MAERAGLPVAVRVIGVVYSVEYVDNLNDVDVFKRTSGLTGQIDYVTTSIRIYDGGRDKSIIRQTLWHELMHAICFHLHIKTDKGELGDNETAIDLLATGVQTVLQDNPELKG